MRGGLSTGEHFHWSGPVASSHVIVDAAAYYAAFYRAASLAQGHIVITGWQFDTHVELLRGAAAQGAPYPVELLPPGGSTSAKSAGTNVATPRFSR